MAKQCVRSVRETGAESCLAGRVSCHWCVHGVSSCATSYTFSTLFRAWACRASVVYRLATTTYGVYAVPY